MFEYIDVNTPADMSNLTEAQQRTLTMLPKLEKFCAENELSALDAETLASVLMRKAQCTKFKAV